MQPRRKKASVKTTDRIHKIPFSDWRQFVGTETDGTRYDTVVGSNGQKYDIKYARWSPGMPGFIKTGSVWVVVAFHHRTHRVCQNYVYGLGPHGRMACTQVGRHIAKEESGAIRSLSIPCGNSAITFVLCATSDEDRFPVYLDADHPQEHPEDFIDCAGA